MTEIELREKKKELLIEFVDAEDALAALQEKRNRMMSTLNTLSQCGQQYLRVVGPGEATVGIDEPIVLDPEKHPNVETRDVIEIARELRNAHRRVTSLRDRKKALGLP